MTEVSELEKLRMCVSEVGLDPTLVRVIFAVLAFFSGLGVVAYLVAWALIPEEGEPVSIAEKIINKGGSASG